MGYNVSMKYRRIYMDGYSYFLTLVTQGRRPLLVEHIDLLREAFRRSMQRYVYRIEAIVVLPDHLHMIITPRVASEYSHIVRHIKRGFVYGLPKAIRDDAKTALSTAKYRRSHSGIWQERFYEHTIRDEKDWQDKMAYIRDNPVKHGLAETGNAWPYGSFAD